MEPEEMRCLHEAFRNHEPWLEWAGKREQQWCVADPVALHIHERISTQAILKVARREDIQRDLFADPEHEYREAVQFYKHPMDWTNRMILGDSLSVMASLARREALVAAASASARPSSRTGKPGKSWARPWAGRWTRRPSRSSPARSPCPLRRATTAGSPSR